MRLAENASTRRRRSPTKRDPVERDSLTHTHPKHDSPVGRHKAKMVKQKNHTARNKTVKEHANGIKRVPNFRYKALKHMDAALPEPEVLQKVAEGRAAQGRVRRRRGGGRGYKQLSVRNMSLGLRHRRDARENTPTYFRPSDDAQPLSTLGARLPSCNNFEAVCTCHRLVLHGRPDVHNDRIERRQDRARRQAFAVHIVDR